MIYTCIYDTISPLQGMLAVGLFVEQDQLEDVTGGMNGLFHGGGFYLLGVQTLACVVIAAWSGAISFLLLYVSHFSQPTIYPCKKSVYPRKFPQLKICIHSL